MLQKRTCIVSYYVRRTNTERKPFFWELLYVCNSCKYMYSVWLVCTCTYSYNGVVFLNVNLIMDLTLHVHVHVTVIYPFLHYQLMTTTDHTTIWDILVLIEMLQWQLLQYMFHRECSCLHYLLLITVTWYVQILYIICVSLEFHVLYMYSTHKMQCPLTCEHHLIHTWVHSIVLDSRGMHLHSQNTCMSSGWSFNVNHVWCF